MALFIASFFEQLRLAEAWIMAKIEVPELITPTTVLRATGNRATSSGVRCSRVRRSAFLGLRGAIVRFGPIPSTPEGAPAPLGGALRRPFGLAPVIIRHLEYSG